MIVQNTVLMSLPEYRLVWARTLAEARVIACESPIAVFVIDVELPDGNGIDFLMEVGLLQPEARAVVMSGNPLPVYRERTKALGNVRFFEKPFVTSEFVNCLAICWSRGILHQRTTRFRHDQEPDTDRLDPTKMHG
jgi:DNA-binding NtrC family response regulator